MDHGKLEARHQSDSKRKSVEALSPYKSKIMPQVWRKLRVWSILKWFWRKNACRPARKICQVIQSRKVRVAPEAVFFQDLEVIYWCLFACRTFRVLIREAITLVSYSCADWLAECVGKHEAVVWTEAREALLCVTFWLESWTLHKGGQRLARV